MRSSRHKQNDLQQKNQQCLPDSESKNVYDSQPLRLLNPTLLNNGKKLITQRKNKHLAWRLRLAHKESELAKLNSDDKKANPALNTFFNELAQVKSKNIEPPQLEADENSKEKVFDNKCTSPLPQNLKIVTYRGLNDIEAKKLANYQIRQQIVESDIIDWQPTKSLSSTNKVVQQFKNESIATLSFSKTLLKNLWRDNQAKLDNNSFNSKTAQLKANLVSSSKEKIKLLKQSLLKWRTIWQNSPAKCAKYNAEHLANQPKSLLKSYISLQASTLAIVCTVIILLAGYSFYSWHLGNKEANKLFHLKLAESKGLQLAGQLTEKTVELQQINLNLAYPSFSDEYLNNKIKKQVDGLIQPYILAAKNIAQTRQSRFKPLLVVNYDATLLAKRLLSVVFTLNYYEKGSKQTDLSDWQYSSLYYDLPNHQLLTLNDLLPNFQHNIQEMADNFSALYRYERKENLGLKSSEKAMQNLLFTKDKLVLIIDPKHCKANLTKSRVDRDQLISKGGSRELFSNYLGLNYQDAAKFFNNASELKLPLNYDAWAKYYTNDDEDKLLPYDTLSNENNFSLPYKFLALTINGLPEAKDWDKLSKIFQTNHAHVSFFISLKEASSPDKHAMLKSLLQAGHEVGALITSDDLKTSEEQSISQLALNIKTKLSNICQTDINYVRVAKQANYSNELELINSPIISSNNLIEHPNYTSETISKLLEHNPEPGDIISLKVESTAYISALEHSLANLHEQQVRYVSVSECAAIYKHKLKSNRVYDAIN